MAITSILEAIPDYNPVYNPIEVVVDSSQKLQPNFRYVFQIHVGGVLVATKKSLPSQTNAYGYCDVGEILAAYVAEQIPDYTSDKGFEYGLESPIIDFQVYYGEEYGTPPVTFEPTMDSGLKYAWSASLNHVLWTNRIKFSPSAAFTNFTMQTPSTTRPFLTNYKTPTVKIEDLGWHFIMLDTDTDADHMEIKTFDSAGALISTFAIDNNVTTGVTEAKLLSVASSPQSLNNVDNAQFSVGVQPVIISTVASYTIEIQDSLNVAIGETLTFTLGGNCRYTPYRLHFLNRLGGFDAFNFTSRNEISTKMDRKQYSRHENRILSTGALDRLQQYDGKQDYHVTSQDSLKVRSEYLTQAENEWLKELIQSPQIYLEFNDSGVQNFRPIRMKTSSWTEKITTIDKLFKLELNLDLSHADRIQRR